MFDLHGKTALITGATGGIGAAIATALHSAGAHVGISGRRTEKLEALKAELGSERVSVLPADLGVEGAPATLAAEALAAMERVDILVNNAGVTRDGLAMRMSAEDWNTVLTLNLERVFQLTQSVLKPMMKARWGRIINIASVVGVTGNPGQANYVAAKAGLIGMGKAVALEVASRGITVNAIAPGFIRTAMTEKLNEKQQDAILGNIPMKAMGTPEDIAATALYLASDSANYITGQTLHVNGGMAMI